MEVRQPLRLGSIEFINSLPVDLALLNGKIDSDFEIISAAPAALNQKILAKQLDASPVSALWYAEHQQELLVFPDLSISSESGVQSVLLFSRFPIEHLKNKPISVTPQGRTTPALLEIICRLKYGFRPNLKTLPQKSCYEIPEHSEAMLLIGDDALVANEKLKGSGCIVTDLAEEWKEWTLLPFVFALWVVRRDVFTARSSDVFALHQALLRSKQWGAENPDEILRVANSKTNLPADLLKKYFSCLSYGFNGGLKCGLKLYYEYAVRCGIVSAVREIEMIENRKPVSVA